MNTVKKGDAFEDRIFNYLKNQISDNLFIAKPEHCLIYQKKGYFSRDRNADIIFDISIEIYLPGAQEYLILILVECKDYSSTVSVDNVEEFWAKIEQVKGAKGIFASSNKIQSGAFEFAKSKKIALIRHFEDSGLKWVLQRSPSLTSNIESNFSQYDIHRILTGKLQNNSNFDYLCFTGRQYTCSMHLLFREICDLERFKIEPKTIASIIAQQPKHKSYVPYRSKESIEKLTAEILRETKYKSGAVDLNLICVHENEKTGLSIVSRSPQIGEEHVLGMINFLKLEITLIHHTQQNLGRSRFTLAHELGHYFLGHRNHMVEEYTVSEDFDSDTAGNIPIHSIRRMEQQANHFAACLLLPEKVFQLEFIQIARMLNLRDRGFGLLFVDQGYFIHI
jgi:Zn-dependent peptidase ImmA (M78 family)